MAGEVNVATLTATLKADTRKFSRDMGKAEKAVDGYEKEVKSASRSTDKMTKALRGLAALGAVAAGKELFTLGVEAEAWGRRFETVFAGVTDEMNMWVDSMNERFGVAEERLRGSAAAVGDLLVPMGFARTEAASMTQEILTLSAGLAEWTGGTVDAQGATDILTKALLGERESLITLGVKISELDVTQRLAAKGQANLTGELLKQARAQATLELITEQTTDAMAAFGEGQTEAQAAATSAAAAFDQMKIEMSALVIQLAPLITMLVNVTTALNKIPGAIAAVVVGIAALALGASATTAAVLALIAALAALGQLGGLQDKFPRPGRLGGLVAGAVPTGSAGQPLNAAGGPLRFHQGGVVPGPRGAEVPAILQAGETVTPAGRGGGTIVVNVGGSVISEGDLVEAVRRGLRSDTIRGGSLEFA